MAKPKLEGVQVRTLGEQAAQRLRQAIAAGHFRAGTRLVETEIAQELGLSRSPLREAFFLLEREGLIVRHPRRGAVVRGLSHKETEEILSLRTLLETFAVDRALNNMTPEAAEHLRALVRDMRQRAAAGDGVGLSELDAEFHEYICDVAQHQVLKQVLEGLHVRVFRYVMEATHSRALSDIAQDHDDLCEAMISCDRTGAAEAVKKHISFSAARIFSQLSQQNGHAVLKEGDAASPGDV